MTAREPTSGEAASEVDEDALLARLRKSYDEGLTKPLAWRRHQLQAIRDMLRDHEDEWLEALGSDLSKSPTEGWLTEVGHLINEIGHILSNLDRWAGPTKVRVRAVLRPSRARIVPEPLGVALVISPWNYPLHLALLPAAYALSAGNAVVLKPSELAPATSAALSRLVPRFLDPDAVAVVEGGVPETTALLRQNWDHVFYTGNGTVGRVVMEAAAKNLTPVTLELGGKSPAIVDRSANLLVAARRIAWGKFVNAGQTCVAPDYVLVDRSVASPFVDGLVAAIGDFFGRDPKSSADFARIVNETHFDRLAGLLERGHGLGIAAGGETDRTSRYIAPTVLTGVTLTDELMKEEIFGPVLPVIETDGLDGALQAVRSRDKPLALYLFSEDEEVVRRVEAETSAGGMCVNATLLHLAVSELPFGGVGPSGMGAYHGKAGFDTFSHRKAVLSRPAKPDPSVMYPPYTPLKRWLLRKVF